MRQAEYCMQKKGTLCCGGPSTVRVCMQGQGLKRLSAACKDTKGELSSVLLARHVGISVCESKAVAILACGIGRTGQRLRGVGASQG